MEGKGREWKGEFCGCIISSKNMFKKSCTEVFFMVSGYYALICIEAVE